MLISMIAAVGENLELGAGNELLWHLPDDFAWFPLLDDAQVVSVKVLNTSTNTTAKLDYFFGERG